ncbi:Mor transcription activator family protein [Azoarcus sp. DN11]|uniref:Mor transcription activator family protein n=1 Tax=Azoarcus sp. DN11 TaxID=356837 RepID=UPI0013E3215B|nr:Mor transcription activator family protein [Azoarcus sp. DN11]
MADEYQDTFLGRMSSVLGDELGKYVPVQAEAVPDVVARCISRMQAEFGGEQPYLPKYPNGKPEALAKQVFDAFDGRNWRELAKRFGKTERWIRTMIRVHRNTMRKP